MTAALFPPYYIYFILIHFFATKSFADTNPSNLGLSTSDKSAEKLESRAKASLLSSQGMRNGNTKYCVIDTKLGVPKPLSGGKEFSKEIRLQLMREQQKLDELGLKSTFKRNSNLHEFFGDMFDQCGPPDDDIIAKISGAASSVKDSGSLLGGSTITSKLSYGPVSPGSRPNTVSFERQESSYRMRDIDDLSSNVTFADDSDYYEGGDDKSEIYGSDHSLLTNTFDALCDSISMGSTFGRLRMEDKQLFDKLSNDYERELHEKVCADQFSSQFLPT